MAKTDPVIEAIAQESERRAAERRAPYEGRRNDLRAALTAATSTAAATETTGRRN